MSKFWPKGGLPGILHHYVPLPSLLNSKLTSPDRIARNFRIHILRPKTPRNNLHRRSRRWPRNNLLHGRHSQDPLTNPLVPLHTQPLLLLRPIWNRTSRPRYRRARRMHLVHLHVQSVAIRECEEESSRHGPFDRKSSRAALPASRESA